MPGQHVGYIRVSTLDQSTARQLEGVPLEKVFEDKCSGRDTARPALRSCLEWLREGDTLHVHSIDRLARNLADLQQLVDQLTAKGVVVHFHKEHLVFGGSTAGGGGDPMQRLLFQVMGAFAEFERALIRERQREGIALAKAAGKYKGRKKALSTEQARDLRERAGRGENKARLAREFGVSRQTLYGYLKG
ncbi:recombinase family protein [Megalodesulfovibrio paquesii]